jgi:hypothetical protein
VVCVGAGCGADGTCAQVGDCRVFSLAAGTGLSDEGALIPPAVPVESLAGTGAICLGFAGRSTYAFGAPQPTTQSFLCADVPPDGFSIAPGESIILAYDTLLSSPFWTGAGSFSIARESGAVCDVGKVLSEARAAVSSFAAPQVRFTALRGVEFDFNDDKLVDKTSESCISSVIPVCAPLPVVTPVPDAPCNDILLNDVPPFDRSSFTLGGKNSSGGATCGDGGNRAPDLAFKFVSPQDGFYQFEISEADFDVLLYVRDGGCNGPELACNDDRGVGDRRSRIVVELRRDQEVTIVVDGSRTEAGSFTLSVEPAGAPPPAAGRGFGSRPDRGGRSFRRAGRPAHRRAPRRRAGESRSLRWAGGPS